ncbi:MAG: IS110 family transposase [Sphingobacteriales bacterium]|nr:IS110 family transposase [Sphingobacteriales bacterium]
MTKVVNYVGVDVSKETLDVAIPKEDGCYVHKRLAIIHWVLKALSNICRKDACIVMEATSSYYMPFAYYLHSQQILLSIVNPLSVNHFCKMRMSRAKTDRKDAAMIAQYGKSETPRLWQPKAEHLLELQQLQAILDNLTKQKTSCSNQLEAFVSSGKMSKDVSKIIKKQIAFYDKEIKKVEIKMVAITEKHHSELYKNLQTIPGLGKRTSMLLIVVTDGFTKFENAKELVSYIGICPRLYESGTSVKGKSRICKMGMSRMRQLLYLCSMRAMSSNKQCKEMYERLKQRGKMEN